MRITEPFYFRSRGSDLGKNKQRSILGKRESFTSDTNPKMVAWRRRLPDGTVATVYRINRAGEGVLPIRISRIVNVTGEPTTVEEGVLYMETGVNDPVNVGAENPLRLLPANWQIMDGAPYSGDYQGEYEEIETIYLDDNESEAVGEGLTPSAGAGNAVYLKKLLMGLFPASVFTGLLRLYMQAHYGADNELTTQLRLEVNGTGEILLYVGSTQIGFWSHYSAGIVRVGLEDDLDFRFVIIESPTLGGEYSVRECPIIFAGNTVGVQADYRNSTSDVDKQKILSYLFAHSRIQETNFTVVDEFSTTSVGTDTTGGWHFNNAGTKAACALTQRYIDGSTKYHWKSTKVVVDFGYSTDQDGAHHVTLVVVDEDTLIQWHDVPNVQWWVPNTDFTTTHREYANWLYEPTHKPTEYDYSDAPIYCYYDADDVLQTLTADHTVETYANMQVFDWSSNITPATDPVAPGYYDDLFEGWVTRNKARWFSEMNSINGTTDRVAVGGTNYDMVSAYGTLTRDDIPATGSPTSHSIPSNSLLYPRVTHIPTVKSPDESDWESETRNPYQCRNNYGDQYRYRVTGYYWHYDAVDVYFPIGDAEAVHVATMNYYLPDGSATGVEYYNSVAEISQRAQGNAAFGAVPYYKDPWFCTEDAGTKWGITGSTTPFTPPPIEGEIAVFLHSRDLTGDEGDYAVSVDKFFFRDGLSEDPSGVKFSESWNAYTRKGDFVNTLGHTDWNIGTWTGWF